MLSSLPVLTGFFLKEKKKSKSGNIPAKLQNLVFGVEVCVWEEEKAVCQSPPTPRKK